jgi:hypothetical protein
MKPINTQELMMKTTKILLAVALLSFTAASFANRPDDSNAYVQNIDPTQQTPITGEPFDVYTVNVSANNGCCYANIQMYANGAAPAVAKFGVDDSVWEVTINQVDTSYSVSVLQTNILTQRSASAEITRAEMGHSTNFSFDGYSVSVTSAITAE